MNQLLRRCVSLSRWNFPKIFASPKVAAINDNSVSWWCLLWVLWSDHRSGVMDKKPEVLGGAAAKPSWARFPGQEQHFRHCEVTSLQYGIRLLADEIYKITPQESCFMLPHAHDFKDFGAREIESVSREMIPNYMSLDNVTRWQSNCLLHLLLQSRILWHCLSNS